MDDLPVIQQHPPERSATIGEAGRRKWVYSDVVYGKFIKWRDILAGFLIVFYLAAPWLSINGQPFLRFDLPNRRFSILGATFLATDIYLLALFFLIATIALFWFSAVFGRLWCGWACPQTVYLEGVFRRIERWIEGTPAQRKKLDSGPHDESYWIKKLTKHGLYWMIATGMALSFTAYFVAPDIAYPMFVNFGDGHPAAMAIAVILTSIIYFDFAWFREQFCQFLCPYARIQSVFLDEDSLIIGYDPTRGEPRGALRPDSKGQLGDCIDCNRCVQVCPAGIDIRDGLQLECVQCTACIDACDMVMEKIGRPTGLIRYDSLSGIEHKKRRVIRPRVVLYTTVLLLLGGLLTTRLLGRQPVDFSVVRQPGTPYLVQEDGTVRNMLLLHMTNTEATLRTVSVVLRSKLDGRLLVPGEPFEIKPGERIAAEAFVLVPGEKILKSATEIELILKDGDQEIGVAKAKFLGPVYREREDNDE